MSAKEMFEELEMEQEIVVGRISYHFKNDMDYPIGIYAYIDFDLINRKYHTNMINPDKEIINAINKQVEELGWKVGSDNE